MMQVRAHGTAAHVMPTADYTKYYQEQLQHILVEDGSIFEDVTLENGAFEVFISNADDSCSFDVRCHVYERYLTDTDEYIYSGVSFRAIDAWTESHGWEPFAAGPVQRAMLESWVDRWVRDYRDGGSNLDGVMTTTSAAERSAAQEEKIWEHPFDA